MLSWQTSSDKGFVRWKNVRRPPPPPATAGVRSQSGQFWIVNGFFLILLALTLFLSVFHTRNTRIANRIEAIMLSINTQVSPVQTLDTAHVETKESCDYLASQYYTRNTLEKLSSLALREFDENGFDNQEILARTRQAFEEARHQKNLARNKSCDNHCPMCSFLTD